MSANPTDSATAAPEEKSNKFPAGIPFIVGNEGAERFSFYGMRAILYVYMSTLFLQFQENVAPGLQAAAEARATQVNHLFIAGVYAFPMIGAILADRLFGKYNVIFWVSLIYCGGHAVLAVAGRLGEMGQFGGAEIGMYIGLSLIAIGSGGIKPCVSANVGDQFSAENGHLVTKVYQIFYFIINFGSFLSTLITPFIYNKGFSFFGLFEVKGPEWAFGIPGVVMGVATVVFWMGRKKFRRVSPNPGGKLGVLDSLSSIFLFGPIAVLIVAFFAGGHGEESHGFFQTYWPHMATALASVAAGVALFAYRQRLKSDNGFLAVSLYAVTHQKERKPGQGFFEVGKEKYGEEAVEGPPAVIRIMIVFSMVSFFWALFDQHSSTWIKQAQRMDLGLTVPTYLGYFALVATGVMAFYGFAWLMLWVSNIKLPKAISLAILGAVGVAGLACGVADFTTSAWTTIELGAAQISALNPLMVMLIIPLMNVAVYGPMERRGTPIKPLVRMTVGMFLAASAFAIAALLQARIEALQGSGDQVHVLWQTMQYWVMTTSEVLVSITGLEFAYTQAPRAMKSTLSGFWLLTVTAGNIIVAFLAPLQTKYELSEFFWLFTGLMAAAACVFSVLAYFYKGKSYLQQAKEA